MVTPKDPASRLAPETDWAELSSLTYDWNQSEKLDRRAGVVDETLRDGLQSPSARDPAISRKLELLERATELGLDCFALGFPASRSRQFEDALQMAKHVAARRLSIEVCCAARTLAADITPIVEIAERTGVRIQVGMFVGSSPIRQFAEGWTLDHVQRLTESAVSFAVRHGLEVLFVTEDSTRSRPQTLKALYRTAIRAGARRVCVADTVGHATPEGALRLVQFVREIADELEPSVAVEWHGHRDRGVDVANCLAAYRGGADRCHGTALGIGERCGNVPLELLLVNLALLGWRRGDLSGLPAYVNAAATALGFSVAAQQPIVGSDAFRTASGAHAAAVAKARALGSTLLADRVFSAVPAALVGRSQQVDIGPASGEANVVAWLSAHGLAPERELVQRVLSAAKAGSAVLSETEILGLVRAQGRETHRRPLADLPSAQMPRISRG